MFSGKTERALLAAMAAHDGQVRKGVDAGPYVVHPIHVAIMLARWGMPPEVLQAAVLHDVVEDSAEWTVVRVREEFGDRVASIVDELTEDKSRTWQERKDAAVAHVVHMSPEACAVKAADQLHNLESLVWDLEQSPDRDRVWATFRGGRDRTLEYAGRLVRALDQRVHPLQGRALRDAYERLLELA